MYHHKHHRKSVLRYVISAFRKPKLREAAVARQIPALPREAIDAAFKKFQSTLSPSLVQQMNGRLERGLAMARNGSVYFHMEPDQPDCNRMFQVKSSVSSNPPYLVDLQAKTCACPDSWKGNYCKHRIAASVIELALKATASPKTYQPASYSTSGKDGSQPSDGPALKEQIIWGMIKQDNQILGVEIISMNEETALVRALPKIIDGKKLQPQFPFDGHLNTATVSKRELFRVKVFQHAEA